MKISKKTIDILKNFTSINQTLHIKGDTAEIRTITDSDSIFAIYKCEEIFPKTFSIFDLNQFISVLSLFKAPEISFKDKYVLIGDPTMYTVKYYYTSDDMVTIPPQTDISMGDILAEFDITEEQLSNITKASSILNLPNLKINSKDGKVFIEVFDEENTTSNKFLELVGESDKEFSITFDIGNLKFKKSSYSIKISDNGLASFETDNLIYFIPSESE